MHSFYTAGQQSSLYRFRHPRAHAKVCADEGKAGYLSFFQKLRRPSGYFVFLPGDTLKPSAMRFSEGNRERSRSVGILPDESSRMQDRRMLRIREFRGTFFHSALPRLRDLAK